MIAFTELVRAKAEESIYCLEIALVGSKPRIWRRLQVPGNANLGWLHAVIQVAMGWTNSHLHQYRVGDRLCADPDNLEQLADDPPVLDETKVLLAEAASQPAGVVGYEYDFGDSWMHQITVEEILPAGPTPNRAARCLGGARACPPEDCGGLPGYTDMLKVLKNPKHPEHQSIKEWLGYSFDPAAFDSRKANIYLTKLKWPHVSESQLRKVLMGRDGYRG